MSRVKISELVAREKANCYIATLDLKGWRYEVVEVKSNARNSTNWTIVVERYSPEGTLVDGPAVLTVDGYSGEVSAVR